MIEAYTAVSVIFDKKNKISVMAKGTINLALGKSNSIYLNADKITADMSKYGVMYMFRDYNMDPSAFVSAKLACAGGFGLLGFMAAPNEWIPKIIGITIGLILGFIAPDIFIRISNRQDNDKMMTDIQTIYTTLKIHARAGVYVTDSLIECQRNIENGRLKQALNEMNNNILASRVTIDEAVDQFNARFCNEQIDNLSVVIKQALHTGRSADMLEDISKQIDTNNFVHRMKVKDRIKRESAFIQVTFFTLITVILLYLVVMELMQGLAGM
jgi:hypothetical protein